MATSERPSSESTALLAVRELHAAGKLAEALQASRQIVAESPGNAQAWAIVGMLSHKLGDVEAALTSYRRAIEESPHFAEAHFNLGNLLLAQGETAAAVAALRRAADLDPSRAALHNNLGNALSQLGDHAAAEASFERALSLSPSAAHFHRNLGTALRVRGELARARTCFERALALEPRWAKALQSLANTAMELGEWGVALSTCQRWLEQAPRNVEALGLAAIALDELGQTAAADSLLDADRLLKAVSLTRAPDGGSLSAFNAALRQEALTDPSLRVPATTDALYHCPTLLLSGDVGQTPGSASELLRAWVHTQIESYVSSLSREAPDHPYVAGQAPAWSLKSWFAVLDREGQLEPHVHYDSYVSAVYYACIPSDMQGAAQAGYFELSGGPSRFPCRHVRAPRAIQPREGLLLLFPSYFYHRTLPFQASAPRISVAFDAVPSAPRPV